MKYHIEVRSKWEGHERKECIVTDENYGLSDVLAEAQAMATDAVLSGADEVIDIWVIKDEAWQANRWRDGKHFTFDELRYWTRKV